MKPAQCGFSFDGDERKKKSAKTLLRMPSFWSWGGIAVLQV